MTQPFGQKIGVIIHDLSPGGTERIALRLAEAWSRLGREVFILCGDAQGPLAQIVPTECTLVSPPKPIRRGFNSRRRLGVWAAACANDLGLAGLFLPGNYHFPVLDGFKGQTGRPIIVAKLSNALTRRNSFPFQRMVALRLMRRRLQRADHVVAMSPALADEARRLLGNLLLSIIPEPILADDEEADTGAARSGIIAAGRFVPQKNFSLAMEAVAKMPIPANLTILGDGEELEAVRNRANALDINGRVQLPGRVNRVLPYFRRAKVFLLSSRYEGYPAVVIEAIDAGCRIVATDCSPAIREIIDDPDIGEVVDRAEPSALAAALHRQLHSPPPPAAAIRRITSHHRIGGIAKEYLQLMFKA